MSTINENLWNESIDEFIDWDNGISSLDNLQKTEGKKVSGGMIRELLQERLQRPIYVKDTGDGYVRIFSSQKAYTYWATKPTELENALVLYKMPKASEYETIFEVSGNSGTRYINAASDLTLNDEAALNMSWKISKNNVPENQNVRLDITITNKSTGKSESFSDSYNPSQTTASYRLESYLDLGQNDVYVYLTSNKGASGFINITINVFNFKLDVDFDYFDHNMHGNNQPIKIAGYKVTRNITNAPVDIKCNIDGRDIELGSAHHYAAKQDASSAAFDINEELMANPEESASDPKSKVIHTMQMWAETTFPGSTNVFISNVLYWTFEIPALTTNTIYNHFLDYYTSIDSTKIVSVPVGSVKLYANQYLPFELDYSHYTDSMRDDLTITVYWYLVKNGVETFIGSTEAQKGQRSIFKFTPEIASEEGVNAGQIFLVAKRYDADYANFPEKFEELLNIEMIITPGQGFYETDGYSLKLSAFGRTNDDSDTMSTWEYKKGNETVSTRFVNIDWSAINGWNSDSFRTCGTTSYAEVIYQPLVSFNANFGKTIEIDFESEKVNNPEEDVIILIGNKTGARIEITPNRATLYNNSNTNIIETNFKSNERVHLSFIFNTQGNATNISNSLVYIVNNGIFERAASADGEYNTVLKSSGYIKLGGSRSGVRVYSIRVYDKALSYTNAYNNWVFDSTDKMTIKNNNNILNDDTGLIDYDKCKQKMDVILIEGDLTNLLKSGTDKTDSTTDVTISRISRNKKFDFTCERCQIRKHGQSTLNYPVPSMKFWLNKSKSGDKPKFTCEGQQELGLAKNRYVMKEGCIPSNKFVLQANYADSSGVHNGSFQRLINQTWYNAKIDGEYKLRTLPQLFTSNQKITRNNNYLNDNNDIHKELTYGTNEEGKQWKDYFGTDHPFPYKRIEIGPESFPCLVFYSDSSSGGEITFLGQYVFMEDKKADFLFGERSIYCDKSGRFDISDDPFVLTTANNNAIDIPGRVEKSGLDIDENRIWNNENVLRFEGLTINSAFSSFVSWTDANRNGFDSIVAELDDNGDPTGNNIYCFERDFEMIYPDPDDIQGKDDTLNGGKDTTKFGADSKFLKKAKPFIDFFRWITDTKNNYNKQTDWWASGVYETPQEAFIATASSHLDLYKLAAYYIFAMRFGLVDSMERNAQYKTYDGYHWHLESWDMDIALGNQNTGGIAFEPPVDRDTTFKLDSSKYAFAGKVGRNGTVSQSNWLWDALEGWDYWIETVVPTVAHELYRGKNDDYNEAGLSYETVSDMFDNEYQNKWCEILYNESCNYKYIISRGGDNAWLNWLQGARTTHRHWWLSKSMNYYDAKWSCGEYKSKSVYIQASHNDPAGPPQDPTWDGQAHTIKIVPSTDTFISIEQNPNGGNPTPLQGIPKSIACSPNNPAVIDITHIALDAKVPLALYGSAFYEEIDLSIIAKQASMFKFSGCYDNILGATLKKVNVGCPIKRSATSIGNQDVYEGYINGLDNVTISHFTDADNNGNQYDVFKSLQYYNIEGLLQITSIYNDIRQGNLTELTEFYARGSGIDAFYSAEEGNRFETLCLPGENRYDNRTVAQSQFNILDLKDTTWNVIEFWDGNIDHNTNLCTYTKTNAAWGVRYNIPISLKTVKFEGSTCKNYNSMRFILNWIDTIEKWLTVEITQNFSRTLGGKVDGVYDYTDCETIEDALRVELRNRQLTLHGIQWDSTTIGDHELLSYDQLSLIAEFNRGQDNNPDANKPLNGEIGNFSGYIELSRGSSELSAEQLTKIKSWFGDGVFTKNSKGLVIDQNLPYTRISVGGDAYTQINPFTGVEEIYLDDGCTATLGATKFSLSNKKRSVYWYLSDPSNSNIQSDTQLWFCELLKDTHDNYSLIAHESDRGQDYDIMVGCSIIAAEQDDEEDTTGSDFHAEILIHIKAVKYPEYVTLECDNTRNLNYQSADNSLRTFVINKSVDEKITSYVFHRQGLIAQFYPKFSSEYDPTNNEFATVNDVIYSLYDSSGRPLIQNISYTTFARPKNNISGGQFNIGDDNYLKYYVDADKKYGIVLGVPNGVPNSAYIYRLALTIKYSSGKTTLLEAQLIAMNDSIPVIQNNGTPLRLAIDAKYQEINGSYPQRAYYKSDLISLTGTLSFSNYRNIDSLTTNYNNPSDSLLSLGSVFEFLPNITEVDLSGCTNLRLKNYDISESGQATEDKYNLSFRNCPNLQVLKLTGCTSLGKDKNGDLELTRTNIKNYTIDLSYCTNIKEVYAQDTYIDITIPSNAKLTQIHYGHPKTVELVNQNSLDANTVTITSNANITKIKLTTDNAQKIGLFNILTNILMQTPV